MRVFAKKIFEIKPLNVSKRGLKFVKRVVDQEGKEIKPELELEEGKIQYFDLSTAQITEDSMRLEIIQNAVDKLTKKHDTLVKEITELQYTLAIMSTSVQMLAENHMQGKVNTFLKQHSLCDTKNVNFLKVNTLNKLEEYLKTYARDNNVRGVEDAIKRTIPYHFLSNVEGNPIQYSYAIETSSNWSSSPLNQSKGGRTKSMLSGDVSIHGSDDTITRSLHRAIRIPVLLRRYTTRINQALYKSTEEQSLDGMENITIFLLFGEADSSLPDHLYNRLINSKELDKISNTLIDSIEGEVYIPSDEELIKNITKDPSSEFLGVWRILTETEFGGVQLGKVKPSEEKTKLVLALLLRIMYLHKFDLVIGTCLNKLQ